MGQDRQCLIIFSRYPEPGKTKTRLIPALGAEGAAMFHRQMTEHTLKEVRALQQASATIVEVHFAGGNQQGMQAWLGGDLVYRQQGEGDLGTRMASAFARSFAVGMTHVIIIGTDCPDLKAPLMVQAFQTLNHHDLVLGPAEDGGYYLIGLQRLVPELFVGVSWGTATVRQRTVEIAKELDLAIAYLPVLSDIDRPEDLVGRSF